MGTIIAILITILVAGFVIFRTIKKKKEDDNIEDIIIQPGDSNRDPIKKALLIGINKYDPSLGSDLNGCVNDIENIRNILIRYFAFDTDNIRVLTDSRATKSNILDRLSWVLSGNKEGDELVIHYSGHGSQVRDRNGDELNDGLDEILCPHDLDWDDPLTDDIIGSLFDQIPEGVNLTMICDSCHSGTMTRDIKPGCNTPDSVPRRIIPPFDIRARSLGKNIKKRMKMGTTKETLQNHVLLSGCEDEQTSADAYIDGKYQGALTWALTSTIKENPDINWYSIHDKVVAKLKSYTQNPQLSGSTKLLNRKLFGGPTK